MEKAKQAERNGLRSPEIEKKQTNKQTKQNRKQNNVEVQYLSSMCDGKMAWRADSLF